MLSEESPIHKALVGLAIEKALFDMGGSVYEKVVNTLNKKYKCYLPDCYEQPEKLVSVLEDLYGVSAKEIIRSIHATLDEFSYQKKIGKFLQVVAM